MSADRRDFMKCASLLTALSGLTLGTAGSAVAKNGNAKIDQKVFDFWAKHKRAPYDDFVSRVQVKGARAPQAQDSTFLFASAKGLVPAATLTPSDIKNLPTDGDTNVEVHVERLRPSTADAATLADLQSGTMRIDVKQVTPMVGVPEALAWTAMATLASQQKGQSIPTLNNVKFDPGTAWGQFQKIPLTGGLGFWSWNFFMKKREDFWGELLDTLFSTMNTLQPILPLLGIPGIAVSGLKYLDQMLGVVQAQGDSAWMFRGLDVAVCSTNQSYQAAGGDGANKVFLTNGTYIIAPENQVAKFDPKLEIQSGYLVPPNTQPLNIFNAASQVAPDVSYMTISVSISAAKAAETKKTGGQ